MQEGRVPQAPDAPCTEARGLRGAGEPRVHRLHLEQLRQPQHARSAVGVGAQLQFAKARVGAPARRQTQRQLGRRVVGQLALQRVEFPGHGVARVAQPVDLAFDTLGRSIRSSERRLDAHALERLRKTHDELTGTLTTERDEARDRAAIISEDRKDLSAELRSRELLSAMLVFALLVILIFNFALELDIKTRQSVTAGVLWATFAFAGTLGLNRSMAIEKDRGCMDGLLLAPVDRSAIYFGKVISNLAFMLIVEAIVLPVYSMLYNVNLFRLDLVAVIMGQTTYPGWGYLINELGLKTWPETWSGWGSHVILVTATPGCGRAPAQAAPTRPKKNTEMPVVQTKKTARTTKNKSSNKIRFIIGSPLVFTG